MKYRFKLLPIIILLFITSTLRAQTLFSKGVNLTNWFQTGSARQIQFTKYTKQDFIRIKSLGCDVIRLPINLHFMTNGSPDYVIDPLFFDFMDQVVDWAEELQIHLLLDNHTFDPNENTDPSVDGILLKVWPQMAEHFKNRSNYVYYEVLNEPHGISTAVWCQIQQKVIDAIRAVDTKHTIVVGPSGYNSYNELKYMPVYTDNNLIYTFHFYDPFVFTHQGATWTNYMQDLAGIPFPYNASGMPATPGSAKGSWVEGSLNNYKNDGTVAYVKQMLDVAVNFKNSRNVNLFCGEFGVYIPNSPHPDRVYWYDVVRKYLEEKGIAWTIWDYQGGFGLFEKGTSELFDYDLDTGILQSLNFNIPEQKEFVTIPDVKSFDIYTDYIGPSISESGNAGNGTIDYYSSSSQSGKYAIYWTGSSQYAGPGFDFKPDKDLSELLAHNYELDFWIKGDSPNTKFEIRFVDSKTAGTGDHPWRMSYTIDPAKVQWNGAWQQVVIPLKSFKETGSWDNAWFSPVGKFDWKAVNRIEFISEYGVIGAQKIWFDEIRIKGTPVTSADEQLGLRPFDAKAYPNPFRIGTTIEYRLPTSGWVNVDIFDLKGRKVATLVKNELLHSGNHQVQWPAGQKGFLKPTEGVYICRITALGKTGILKLVVQGR
jgi:endoglucanase